MTPRIKVFTRSFDLRLYRLAKGLFEPMGYPCVRLTDQSADGYFYTILKDLECDIAVNIDEDAFLISPQTVKDLISLVLREGYANAGCPDSVRINAPNCQIVTNPFFNIFNLALIRTKFDKKKIRKQNSEDREPYYPFFLWLASEFRTLYLPYEKHADSVTTVAQDPQGRTLCLHTWYARFYSTPSWIVRHFQPNQGNQKKRIDAIIQEAYQTQGINIPEFGITDRFAFIRNKITRWIIKVPQRISRWPFKLKRKLHS